MQNFIDPDCDMHPISFYSKNPSMTCFKKVTNLRPTHHNRWTQIFDYLLEREIHLFNDDSFNNIHLYSNLSLIITFPDNSISFLDALDRITNITVHLDGLEVLNMNGYIIHKIIGLNNDALKKIKKVWKHKNQLIIPIQSLLFGEESYLPNNISIDISFSSLEDVIASIGITCVYLTDEEKRQFNFSIQEFVINRFHYHTSKTQNIPIDVMLPIKTIILLSETRIDANVDFMKFCNSSYNYFNDNMTLETDVYYLHSVVDTVRDYPCGKIIPNEKIITIKPDPSDSLNISGELMFTVIYCCHDYLQFSPALGEQNANIKFLGLLLKKENNNTYPLTKISETEFIEGYWFPLNPCDNDYNIGYPKPIVTDTPVCQRFLDKLKLITNSAKKNDYFGWSKCRICKCVNGGSEYRLTSNGKTFRYPSGLLHYYEAHNVQPSKEFYDFVMGY